MVIANFDGTQETISDVGELEEAAPWTVIVPEQSVVPEWDIVLLQLNKADETAPSEAQESRTRVMVSFSGDGSGLLLTQFGELPDYGTPADATEEEVDIAGVSGQYITSPAGQTLRWSACSTGFDLTSDARLDRAVMFDIAESINTAC